MGLLRAGIGSVGGVLADQWKEFFYCDAIENDTLVLKGKRRVGKNSSNRKGDENVISNGSVIAVADGQCMIIVDQGKVVEVCAEPGEFVYDTSTEPSIFTGSLQEGLKATFANIGKRFTFGGEAGKDQRIYYFNTREIRDNRFGTPTPIPFRVVDRNIGLDIDVSVRCNGLYSYQIADPILFYTNVCGNVAQEFTRDELDSQLKAEFLTALQPAFAKISELEIRPSALPGHVTELTDAMNEALTAKWQELRGLRIVSVGVNQVTLPEEDAQMIKEAQRAAILRNPTMAAATLTSAQAEAMKMAASNENGAMMGFMGMGMAAQSGGMNAQNLYAMGQQGYQQQGYPQQSSMQQNSSADASASNGWKCSCGATVTGKFCPECGAKRPEPAMTGGWRCSCGTMVTGNFCPECGAKRPAAQNWRCSCGTVNTGKFCPNCGAKNPMM